ncbi:MAG: amino acid--tRNA ligase-related protein [Nanoarchaeota archaeon]
MQTTILDTSISRTVPPTHQRARDPTTIAVTRIQAAALAGARAYFDKQAWVEIPTPHLTRATGACENIDTMYEVEHKGKAFLSQTGQLYLESMLQKGMEGVWTMGPSFRKEEKDDGRHSSEFTLIEFEHHGDFDLLLEHIEGTILSMINHCLTHAHDDLHIAGANIPMLQSLIKKSRQPGFTGFKKHTYADIIKTHGLPWGADIPSSIEKNVVSDGFPAFITRYPTEIKFFNMRNHPEDSTIVNSADLIVPHGGEAVGSAERIIDPAMLKEKLATSAMMKQLNKKEVGIDAFSWYIDCVEHNKPELHSGCGIGLGRVMQYILACDDIRQTSPFPVTPDNIE